MDALVGYLQGVQEVVVTWAVRHPGHALVEALLVAFILVLLLRKSYRPTHDAQALSKAEEDALIAEWEPVPLVERKAAWTEGVSLAGGAGPVALVQPPDQAPLRALNLATTGFLGYQTHPEVIDAALECTRVYGVGACGPRGFYGSLRPHLDAEKEAARALGAEDAVLFSSEFQVPASVVPAFAKPGDVLLMDAGVHFGWQTGAQLSRAEVREWAHNDVQHLATLLQQLDQQGVFRAARQRVFVVAEALYANWGDVCPLAEVMELKKRYPFRVMLDESLSLGLLGARGRGLWEQCKLKPHDVELLCFSLGHALGSSGGVCVARAELCSHMRLNCTGYVFSCASPPFVAQAALAALGLLARDVERPLLQALVPTLHRELPALVAPYLEVQGAPTSPLVHLRIAPAHSQGALLDAQRLARIVVLALEPSQQRRRESPRRKKEEKKEEDWQGAEGRVLLAQPRYAPQEKRPPPPSLRLCLHALLPQDALRVALQGVGQAVRRAFDSQ